MSEPNFTQIKSKINFGIKFWLQFENKSILGSGWANLLNKIDKHEGGSLTQAAKECNYSYKYAWNILKRIEKRTGISPVETGKGGRGGGGWVKLNEFGKYLLKIFSDLQSEIEKVEKKLNDNLKIN
jgi:molybdate transport system regulatory protein